VKSLDEFVAFLSECKEVIYDFYFTCRIAPFTQDAMGDVWQRTYKVLANMSERLDYAGKDDKKKFNDTLVGNVKDMVNLLTKFNITGDAKMESMRMALDDAMFGISPDALRHDDVLRAETKGKVDAILSAMAW
jgi:hypothetical protein